MTTSHDAGREALAREVLADIAHDREPTDWIAKSDAVAAMLAFADKATHPPAQAGAASVEDVVTIPREPTQAMMDAGLYHSSHDSEWADVNTMWKAMFDAVTLDGGTSVSAPASPAASGEIPGGMVAGDAGGSFACPICGEEKPHHHTAPVVDAYQTKGSRK